MIEENAQLRAENAKLKEENNKLLHEFTNQQTQLKQLQASNTNLLFDVETLKRENQELRLENAKLKQENVELSARIKTLEKQVADLSSEQKRSQALLHANDLSRMFVYYFVEPYLQGKLWRDLADELANQKADLQDSVITQEKFDTWLNQQPESKILVSVQEFTKERHDLAHTDLKSAAKQTSFLSQMNQYDWDIALPEKASLIKLMLSRLATQNLKRMDIKQNTVLWQLAHLSYKHMIQQE